MTDSVHYCTVSVSGRQYNSNRRRRRTPARRRRRTPARRRHRRRHRVDKEVGDAEQMRETS